MFFVPYNLDTPKLKVVHLNRGQLAQSVEQRPEKPRVRSSILRLPTIYCLLFSPHNS